MCAKNKKLKKFLCLSAAAMLTFLMCAACLLVPAKGENGPCDTGDWAFAYISVENDGDSSNPQGEYKTIYSVNSKDISTVEGISYDRASDRSNSSCKNDNDICRLFQRYIRTLGR